MNARMDQLLTDALDLPADERSALVVALLDSLEGSTGAAISDAWKKDLRQRKQALRDGADGIAEICRSWAGQGKNRLLFRRLRSQPVDGRIAQLVEQLTLNQRVLGSSPSAPTIDTRLVVAAETMRRGCAAGIFGASSVSVRL